jgi:hypothetical protein
MSVRRATTAFMERSGVGPDQRGAVIRTELHLDHLGRAAGHPTLASSSLLLHEEIGATAHRVRLYRNLVIGAIIALGLYFRLAAAFSQPLWADEAESSINALSILESGVPTDRYLGLPLFENTLTEPWPGNEEYEFRDSSYSPKGVAVYHGWLPLYSIAAAQALLGIWPDTAETGAAPRLRHDDSSVAARTIAPRLPALVFSIGFMLLVHRTATEMAGETAGLGALTWAALSERAVLYGHQARYYSLTLMLCALFLYVYLRAYRGGRTRDFAALGLVVGLLFHTHQLSALVVCFAALAGLPRIITHERWLGKGLITVGLVGLAVVPWTLLSGFFSTLSSVPKIFALFQEPGDWFQYVLRHSAPAMIGVAGFALILGYEKWGRGSDQLRENEPLREQATFLLVWTVLCLVAFHTLVPAASYFTGRLTLMLLTPYLILVSIAVALVCDRMAGRWAKGAVIAGILLILAALGEADAWRQRLPTENRAMEPALAALGRLTFEPNDRIYAPPNDHLVWTYYSGLPVQSVAPVRKSFLDAYAGRILYLERRLFDAFASNRAIRSAHPDPLAVGEVRRLRHDLWQNQVAGELARKGFTPEQAPRVPDSLKAVAAKVADYSQRSADAHMRYFANHPVFKGVDYADPTELWFAFFYRFAQPEKRLGVNANFYQRLQGARVVLAPAAALAIYVSAPPARGAGSDL